LLPAVLVVIGAVLRFSNIAANRTWYDEAFTLLVSRLPFQGLTTATQWDVHPPMYYGFMHVVMLLPWDDLLEIRVFSAVCSTISLVLLYQLGIKLGLPREARIAALALMVFSAGQLYYAQEGRVYAYMEMLCLYTLLMILERRWWMAALCFGLVLWSHNYGVLHAGTLGLVALVQEIRRGKDGQWRHVVGAGLVGIGIFLPWVPNLLGQAGAVGSLYWTPQITIGIFLQNMLMIMVSLHIWEPALIPLVGLLYVGILIALWEEMRAGRWMLVAVGLLPIIGAVAVSLLWAPSFVQRGLLPSLPALALIGGRALTRPRTWGGRVFIGGLVLVALVGGFLPWIGQNSKGLAKMWAHMTYLPIPDGATVLHMNDFSVLEFLVHYPNTKNYLFDANCPEEGGNLTDQVHEQLGIVDLDQVPDGPFYFVSLMSPLSYACQENFTAMIDAGGDRLYTDDSLVTRMGVWFYENQ
jgi:uncharacterized membrane protein